MKIILSPAKKMTAERDAFAPTALPRELERTEKILSYLRGLSWEELKTLWGCNDKILAENVERLQKMDLRAADTPAILAYDGIAYQYMAPDVFTEGELSYVQEHLCILSAFYGVLRPLDAVTPYRLEMQAKASVEGKKDLYALWGDSIYQAVRDDDGIIINLASKEYAACVVSYLQAGDRCITCDFMEKNKDGKLITKGTYAKMARGEMVRFMAEKRVEDVEQMKAFDRLGYRFRSDVSTGDHFVFERLG